MTISRFRYFQDPERCRVGETELHCGDCFQLLDDEQKWIDSRIEMTGDGLWVLLVGSHWELASRWDTYGARFYP